MLRITGLMGMFAAFAAAAFERAAQPSFRHGTPKRRGRLHSTRSNRPGKKRLQPAIVGGNWKGAEYLTYAEHDQIKRVLNANRKARPDIPMDYDHVKALLIQ